MKTPKLYLLPLLLCFASCNNHDDDLTVKPRHAPDKTNTGHDIIVCRVNNDKYLQVYRDVPTGLFDQQEIFASPFIVYTPTGDTTEYYISGDRRPDDGNPETSINIEVMVENPVVGMPYKLSPRSHTVYTSGNQANEYLADIENSMVKFSRIDQLVAAGDFEFTAVNRQNDTVHITGYFDVRFER